jgi:[ribosomal protein S18]-alanine N-acetyltransferase
MHRTKRSARPHERYAMNTRPLMSTHPVRSLVPMAAAHLSAVLAIEHTAYAVPWTQGNFADSLHSGYSCQLLLGDAAQLIGYWVAMPGAQEMHLLNLTVLPAEQGHGHGRYMLDALCALCQTQQATDLWLEVRESNTRARALYQRYGFAPVGVRRGYYPQPAGIPGRENAVVMQLPFTARTTAHTTTNPTEHRHALD